MELRDDAYREKYEALPLDPAEVARYSHVAARFASELKSVGGNLVITNQRLLFEPVKTSRATGLLATVFKTAKLGSVGDEIEGVGRWPLLKPWAVPLSEVVSAEAIGDSDRLRVSLRSNESVVFRVAASRWTPRFVRSKNIAARDEVLSQLRSVAAGASSAEAILGSGS